MLAMLMQIHLRKRMGMAYLRGMPFFLENILNVFIIYHLVRIDVESLGDPCLIFQKPFLCCIMSPFFFPM